MALEPVIRRALTILVERFLVLGFSAVKLRALPENGLYAARLRAVGVVWGLYLGVMLAVDADPLFRDHARGEPQPETEEMADGGVQVERAMRLRPVQEDRDARDRDVRKHECNDHIAPPW